MSHEKLTPDLGAKHFVNSLKETFKWDYKSRVGVIPSSGGGLLVTEFDYRQENKIVYEKNGVAIRSCPAIHCMDGPASYALEWNGLKFVFGGDTFPNKWYAKYAKNADLAIHESFPTPPMMIKYEHLSAQSALNVATQVHTVPQAFGIIMDAVKPRMAVAYHFYNDYDTRDPIYDGIRKTYKGPLTMATDLLVWNVTKENIKVRRVIVNDSSWAAMPLTPPEQPDPKQRASFSPFVAGPGRNSRSNAHATGGLSSAARRLAHSSPTVAPVASESPAGDQTEVTTAPRPIGAVSQPPAQ